MNSYVLTQNIEQINHQESINVLEAGKILFFPEHYFSSIDHALMSESILHSTHKNVSYDYKRNKLGAFKKDVPGLDKKLEHFMRGYAEFAHKLIQTALPSYVPHLQWGRTSFRPAQISGRATSRRKDDTRLHVDSFSATPVNGLRILRVFCNINPQQEPRVWNLGEPFAQVLNRFAPRIRPYSKLTARVLKLVKTTKTLRSPYDHYMLHLHDTMKRDDRYQEQVEKIQINFPSQSSWIVFTDHVSHAALSGQYLLEQTFYLPVDKMANPELSPFNEWKKIRPELRHTASR
ncbi:Kdo hydroxylase family protein [Legionella maioricensis]|uniref:Kdo hydroxylase family protein n=1 Tax=Legionella maioricensis TaxID=2896528 RepID=A0A9X2CY85_9GAMM|nr:Kdo hydroxylase family protein [Legionella maioricensis]MCL9682680.1 Kdo hydroxylase family protein [Legionella maioricensis]MCL9687273.1 Kdo hydroxylase family protein [Legionella maioricensis]